MCISYISNNIACVRTQLTTQWVCWNHWWPLVILTLDRHLTFLDQMAYME